MRLQGALTRPRGRPHFPRSFSRPPPPKRMGASPAEPDHPRMNVVVVESPAKAKTINKYLGSGLQGPGRPTATSATCRPRTARCSPDEDFAMSWDVDAKSAKRLNDIAEAAKGADTPDPRHRPRPRGRGHLLARAGGAADRRRRIKGATVAAGGVQRHHQGRRHRGDGATRATSTWSWSTPTWPAARSTTWWASPSRRCCGASCRASRSAGRVQSVGAAPGRRPRDRDRALQDPGILDRRGRRLRRRRPLRRPAGQARGQAAHQVRPRQRDRAPSPPATRSRPRPSRSPRSRRSPAGARPPPPFTTSTLQQEASRKLGFDAQRTMQAAQRLYEGIDIGGETVGLITYMRTDGVQTAPEALDEAREVIGGVYGRDYVPEKPRFYTTKAKNAQEAHEAIRPTSLARNPGTLRLEGDLGRLYELIWKRMIASQMESRAHRAHDHRPRQRRRQDRPARHRPGGALRRLSRRSTRKAATTPSDEERRPACRRWTEGDDAQRRSTPAPTSTSPSRRRATPKPAWSRRWRSSASAGPRPTPRSSPCCATAPTCGWRRTASSPRTRAAWSPPSSRSSSASTSNTTSPPTWRRSSTWSRPASSTGRCCCASSGTTSTPKTEEIGGLRTREVLDALDDALAPFLFPPKADGSDPRACPTCGTGRLSLKTSQLRRPSSAARTIPSAATPARSPRPRTATAASNGDRELGIDPDTGQTVWLKSGRFGACAAGRRHRGCSRRRGAARAGNA